MRVVRAVAAAVVLVLAVAGTPLLLLRVGRGVDPARWAGRSPWDVLTSPDDGTVLFLVLTVVAWVAWALFTLCVAVEIVAVASRWRIRIRLPGLRFPQAVAAGLVLAAASLVVSPIRADAGPVAPGPPAAVATTAAPSVSWTTPGEFAAAPARDGPRAGDERADPVRARVLAVHAVEAGDDLWSLAERYYGDGSRWRTIAAANADRLARHGPDALRAGWRLVVPRADATAPGRWVVVAAGDTLSALAARHLGDAGRWPELAEANRETISDPDELAEGTALRLPETAAGTTTDRVAPAADRSSPPDRPERPEPDGSRTGGPEAGPGDPGDRRSDGSAGPQRAPTEAGSGGRDADGSDADGSGGTPEQVAEAVRVTAGIGGVLAASLVAGIAGRRAWQLRERPVGRRITHPTAAALRLDRALGRRQDAQSLAVVDRALRLVAGWCRETGTEPPRLVGARLGPDGLELETTAAELPAPAPFRVTGRVWTVADPERWSAGPDPFVDQPVAHPALLTLGSAEDGAHVLLDLEHTRLLTVAGARADVTATLTAMAMEAAFCRWSTGTRVTVVGEPGDADWVDALGATDVHRADDLDLVLDRIEARVAAQRAHLAGRWCGSLRLDPDTAEPWAAELLVVDRELSDARRGRLQRLVSDGPPVSVAAVVAEPLDVGRPARGPRLVVDGTAARLRPSGLRFTVQQVDAGLRAQLSALLVGTGRGTTAAPWWPDDLDDGDHETAEPDGAATGGAAGAADIDHRDDTDDADQSDHAAGAAPRRRRSILAGAAPRWRRSILAGARSADPLDADPLDLDTVTVIRPRRARPAADPAQEVSEPMPLPVRMRPDAEAVGDPVIRLLGTIDLLGARGEEPPRARRQCIEYGAWLLEHPGASASAMASGLMVAEGTRRSNMSRLRAWLGEGPEGPYLPDAYSGRIELSDAVSSDWQRFQLLIMGGVNRASTTALTAALELVRGAPLADAAPGQWHWAEELRTDMSSVIRDLGLELVERALGDADLDLARWAAARALAAAAGDEQLLVARVRTEHWAGNAAEVQRLSLQITGQARRLGVDLAEETITVLQQVIEGGIRARHVR